MGKMYYTEEETAAKLGISPEDLGTYLKEQKLRVFQDGTRRMFKADEVDALAGEGGAGEEITLTPADTSSDAVSITEDEQAAPPGKEDTVITAEGISIFDDEDLEIETADPLAKTQVTPSLEDQIALEGVGSGSGLLDLTRESDDTSLGEVLDQIDMEGTGAQAGIAAEAAAASTYAPPQAAGVEVAVSVEIPDAGAGLFGGFAVGGAIVMLFIGAVLLAAMRGALPAYLESMQANAALVIVGALVVIVAAGIIGYFVGKSAAVRGAAMR